VRYIIKTDVGRDESSADDANICVHKLAAFVQTSSSTHTGNPPATDINRTRNLIIAGIAEDWNRNIWFTTVQPVLHTAANRDVRSADAFRIGVRYSPTRKCPILVRRQSVWD
jgi:hypothetical protein